MSDLFKPYDPNLVEKKWYELWEKSGFFKATSQSSKKPFCIVIPPPNVTGILHMGHAMDGTLQDILIRYKRMSGFEALWVPGTDHAGISTQTVVEKHLIAKTGKSRRDFSREAFVGEIWKWKEEKEHIILNQLKRIGSSCDWSRLRFTMDDTCSKAVKTMFKKMFDDGLIYRGLYLINWDPVTQTALADDEIEYEERDSYLWYFRYPLAENSEKHIVIATTRPETILGDTAIAVNPKDQRYENLIGKEVLLPLINRRIPVIADDFVDPAFGTGAVKITPAHDFNDYDTGQRHNLAMINIMQENGKINENGKQFFNLSMQEAREKVVEKMRSLNLLEKIEPYKLRVGLSYRSKAVTEPFLSKQWFIKMKPFKNRLISLVKENKVEIIPEHWKETYYRWIENLRDWCISRQLWWGHRIPIWYHKEDENILICDDTDTIPKEVRKNPDKWRQDEDVLDTWFSSALWPFSVFGWPQKTFDLKFFFPTSTLITGHDILFFWVARMIFMADYALKKVPFKQTFIHGLIYGKSYWKLEKDGSATYLSYEEKKKFDLGENPPANIFSKWEKMSKSKGNIIDPIEIINEYGADATRFALCHSTTHARQIDIDRRRFEEFKNFANKIWNAARFILQNLEENKEKNFPPLSLHDLKEGIDEKSLNLEDYWLLSITSKLIRDIQINLDSYNFDKAAAGLYHFFWDDFCAYYLEIAKPFLFGKELAPSQRKNKQILLLAIFNLYLRLLHPIAPFITEELFSLIKIKFPKIQEVANFPLLEDLKESLNKEACIVSTFPSKKIKFKYLKNEKDFNSLKALVTEIRNLRAEFQIPLGHAINLLILKSPKKKSFNILSSNQHILKSLIKISAVDFIENKKGLEKELATLSFQGSQIFIKLPKELLALEKERLIKEKDSLHKTIFALQERFKNTDFLSKAPEEVIKKTRLALSEAEEKLSNIEKRLSSSSFGL